MRASLLLGALVLGASADTVWTFDSDPPGRAPAAFTYRVTRDSAPARWIVQREGGNGFLAHTGDPAAKGGFSKSRNLNEDWLARIVQPEAPWISKMPNRSVGGSGPDQPGSGISWIVGAQARRARGQRGARRERSRQR